MEQTFKLSPELVGKFEVVNTDSPLLCSRIGDVDFRYMTEAQAEQLIKAGTMYLVKLEVPEIEVVKAAGKKKN